MGSHARLSASSSKKWLNCPLSVVLEEQFKDEESEYAKEGTIAHELGELKIKLDLGRITRTEYINQRDDALKDFKFDDFDKDLKELDDYTDTYKEFVIERYNSALKNCEEAEVLIEERLDYSKYAKDGFGTGDVVICDYENIEIIDLKYGKGVKVDAFENTQLMLYGLGALEIYGDLFDIKTVKMTIFQPRLDNISTYEISTDELLKWGNEVVKPKAEVAFNGLGEAVCGEYCDIGFCKARPLCKAYAEKHLKVADFKAKHPSLLTNDELVDIYDIAITYDKWVKTIKSYILQEMLKGERFTGLKLVEGRSIRSFTDEDKVIEILQQKNFDRNVYIIEKLASVAELEKILGKDNFKELLGEFVDKPKGSPTITTIEDKRPEYNSAELDFQDIGA